MQQLILILHIFVAVAVVGLVLLQQGKGADIGAAFGSGASNTIMGSQGAKPFLFKLTAVLAACFFATSVALTYFASHNHAAKTVLNTTATAKPANLPQGNVALQIKQPVKKSHQHVAEHSKHS